MKIEQKNILTEEETKLIVDNAWMDKKDRLPGISRLALYVALDSPKPSLGEVACLMLNELSSEDNLLQAESWARKWGKTVVCVQPGGTLGCKLRDTEDERNKIFFPLSTSSRLTPAELINDFPQGELATIFLNDRPTTVEAITISFVHMIDELIWDLYRTDVRQLPNLSPKKTYLETVKKVKIMGFTLKTAPEEGILLAKKFNPKTSLRIYGSGVNKDVPQIMGCIIPNLKEEVFS